jgi:peptidyl-prolyl cis-trans isomerase B (cyclophilin B)
VASSKTRQRKLARAKIERQMARRAAKVRRRRQVLAGVVVALVVVLGTTGTVWALGGFSASKKTPEATGGCLWAPADKTANDKLKDVGTPPTSGEAHTGTETMTINLGSGTVVGSIDLAKAPCTGASFKYLAGKHFFDNTTCHRLTTADTYVLQCGDPSGTGQGGPLYTFANENLPPAPPEPSASASADTSDDASAPPTAKVTYPRGTLAMAAGSDANGSQFYIIYKDTQLPADYTVFGTVTQGLDVIDKIAAAGAVDDQGKSTGDGKPKNEVKITTLTVLPTPSPVPSGSGSPSGSAAPSAPTSPSAKS